MPDVSDSVPLREYIEARLDAIDRYYDAKLCAIEHATTLARESMGLRLDGMNEFRMALKDQAAQMTTRTELDGIVAGILADIEALKRADNIAEGKASQTSVILSALLSVAALIIGIISMYR